MSTAKISRLNPPGFNVVMGRGRGRPQPQEPEPPLPCPDCHDGLAQSGYHGPPGDDRGSIPCPRCRAHAFETFCLSGGDILRGTTIEAVFALLADENNSEQDPA